MAALIEALGIRIDEATQRREDAGGGRGEAVEEIAARVAKQVLRVHTVNRGTDKVPCVLA